MTHPGKPPIGLVAFASELRSLASAIEQGDKVGVPGNADGGQHSLAAVARAMLSARQKIGQYFEPSLFADPARDILLDLFAAGEEGRRISVTSCCVAAGVPSTTALRWIDLLKQKGMVIATPDERDGRRILLNLSEPSRHAMARYLQAISGISAELLPVAH